MTTATLPLAGLTVLDLTRMLPGGSATLLLADLGATVIKVEHPPSGDDTRALEPAVGADSSVQHQFLDRNKQYTFLDLKDPIDLERLYDLVRTADAVIESFRPGVADRLGVSFEHLVAIRPELVYVSLSGYGQSGPRAAHAGHDLNFVGYAAGLAADPGSDLEPRVPHWLQADVFGGSLAAVAILSGVLRSRASGEPSYVDLALLDGALFLGGMALAQQWTAGSQERGGVDLSGAGAAYRTYRCLDDRWIVVAAVEPKFWRRVLEIVGRPDLESRQYDVSAAAELDAVFAARPRSEWLALLETGETCISPVLQPDDLLVDAHVTSRGSIVSVGELGLPQVAAPLRFRGAAAVYSEPRPLIRADLTKRTVEPVDS